MANIVPLKVPESLDDTRERINRQFNELNNEVAQQDTRIDNIVSQSGDDITEIVDAREDYATLRDRLDTERDETSMELANIAQSVHYDNHLQNVRDKMINGETVTIVCYGDSTTYGDKGSGRSATPYPQVLQERLRSLYGNPRITVINNGVNARQSDEALSLFDSIVNPSNPDLVIIMFGINDISGKINPINSIEQYKSNIAGMVKKSIDKGYSVIVMTPTFTRIETGRNSIIALYGYAAREVAEAYRVSFIDILRGQQDLFLNGSAYPARIMNDYAHFTDAGYQYIADYILLQALDINAPNSLIVKKRETIKIPVANTKFVKSDATRTANLTQASGENLFMKQSGSNGTYLTFEFYVSCSGMDLSLVAVQSNIGGKLTVLHNGIALPNTINFYADEFANYDVILPLIENLSLGYHKIEFLISNLVQGDGSSSNPEMYISQFLIKPTEAMVPNLLTPTAPVMEFFMPILQGSVRYIGTNTFSSAIFKGGKSASLKADKKLIIETEGMFFDKSGITWFGNDAGNTNTKGFNNGYTLLLTTTNVSLYHSTVNNIQTTFTNSTASITLNFANPIKVRIEHSFDGTIRVYINDSLYITCNSKRYNAGYFGIYNQANDGAILHLKRFEYAYV